MNWNYGVEKPETRTMVRRLGQPVYTANVCVEETEDESHPYKWLSITLPPAVWDRGAIIDAIVRAKYSESQMEAIHNNYLLSIASEEEDAESFGEFMQMQEWRKRAKDEATKVCNEYKD